MRESRRMVSSRRGKDKKSQHNFNCDPETETRPSIHGRRWDDNVKVGFKAGTSRGYGLGSSGSRKLLVVSSCECSTEAADAKSGTFLKELTEKIIYIYIYIYIYILGYNSPTRARAALLLRFLGRHTVTLHIRQDSSRQGIGQSQRPLPDNTQHSQKLSVHASDGIRARNSSKRAAPDPRVRHLGCWNQ
jgi:hypothetical protein